MAYDRVGCGCGNTYIHAGGVAEASRGAGAIHSGGRRGAKTEGECVARGAGKYIVLIAQATAVGVATTGGHFGALETDLRLIRADQAVGAVEYLIRIGAILAKAQLICSLINAGRIVAGLTEITAAVNQLQLPAQCSQNCKLLYSLKSSYISPTFASLTTHASLDIFSLVQTSHN